MWSDRKQSRKKKNTPKGVNKFYDNYRINIAEPTEKNNADSMW